MTRAIVTGGRGFAGRHLERELASNGDDVSVLDRSDRFDVTDREQVRDAFAALRPDVVYHLAAFTHVGASWSAPAETWRVNTEGTLNVLDAARACGARRVLVVGSAEEYGRVDPALERVGEDAPTRPLTPYGASKAAAGLLALQAWDGTGLETVRVRPFNHSGAGQPPRFIVPALAARIAHAEREGTDRIVVGNLDAVRELLDVRDVVRAYRLRAALGEPGAVYNVCRGEGYAVREIAELLLERSTAPLRLEVDPQLVRPVEVPKLVGDPRRIADATGWKPEHELTDTLASVLAEARAGS